MRTLPDIEEDYKGELVRKSIHLCSLSIPIAYYFLDKGTALSILVPLTLAFLLTDLARLTFPPFRDFYHKLFGGILRAHERNEGSRRLNGATYVLLAASLCVWLFPKVITITSFSILIVSDTVAALVGRRIGTTPFLAKSRQGALAFLVSALLVVAFSPKVAFQPIEYLIGACGAVVGTVVESLPVTIDDNLTIPFSVAGTMWLLYYIIAPTLNLGESGFG